MKTIPRPAATSPRIGVAALLLVCLRLPLAAQPSAERRLPLPEAAVQLVIPDAAAFDAALSGGFRKALSGTLPPGDPAGAAFRRTRVGEKLAAQWELFAADLPLTWKELSKLKPRALGLAILAAGDLEAVLVVRTSLSPLPIDLPGGKPQTYKGTPYHLSSRGAGDDRTASRRMGLAWASVKGDLLLATSDRSLHLALDRALEDGGVEAFLPGLASLRLDLDALREDRYFRREFLFPDDTGSGILLSALRLSGNDLVEVRTGTPAAATTAPTWDTASRKIAAAGWEAGDGTRLLPILRRGFLEPLDTVSDAPVPALRPLPDPQQTTLDDRYLIDLTKAAAFGGGAPPPAPPGDRGVSSSLAAAASGGTTTLAAPDLARWRKHLEKPAITGWGWELDRDGARRLVIARAASLDAELGAIAEETFRRTAGAALRAASDGTSEITVGPGLPVLAWRRTGDFLWIARRASDLSGVPEPKAADASLVRWAHLDLSEVRRQKDAWARAEGPFSPQETRPFSDRVLGLLGWTPATRALSVERRREREGFEERVVFTADAPVAGGAPRPSPKSKKKS